MKILHHCDHDGYCAAYVVKHCAVNYLDIDKDDIEYIEMDYNRPTPFDKIEKDETVYIVDFSIPPEDMNELLAKTENVVWIDHHKSAIEKYDGYIFKVPYIVDGVRYGMWEYDDGNIKGIREEGKAGCELAWEYFAKMYPHSMSSVMPQVVYLIGDWDTWRHESPSSKSFHFGATINHPEDIAPYFAPSRGLFAGTNILTAIERGEAIMDYIKDWSSTYCKMFGHEVTIDGLKCFALNIQHINSEYFACMDGKGYDAYIAYAYNGKQWKVSMRSTSHDISDICKRYGGGGHPGAASFWSDTLPDFLNNSNSKEEYL